MWQIREDVEYNTDQFERLPFIRRTGFREYDARWLYPQEINLLGFQCLGAGIGTQLSELRQAPPRIIVGHDYRSYSTSIKHALTVGLLGSGCEVYDVGLGTSPMAYFARSELGVPALAMVTASHNENGWTGVKIGAEPPLTHGPDEMQRLRDIVMSGKYKTGSGQYTYCPGIPERYIAHLVRAVSIKKPLKVVVATGNGTSGMFAPTVLKKIGCEVHRLHCDLDWTFPNYNPNPEDVEVLKSLQEEVLKTNSAIGLVFDGDGDRIGVVDDEGEAIYSDKMGLLIARQISKEHQRARFVVDVKSTGLFETDPILRENNASVEYWITGHSYMKKRVYEKQALAGFEKSGHFIFNKPIGSGYDDAMVSALTICQMLDSSGRRLSELRGDLPKTWQSPTMAPTCPDERKYDVVKQVTEVYEDMARSQKEVCGQRIKELITVNGIRVVLEDGTWGLVRASSNKPSLVVVVESPSSEEKMKAMFVEIDSRLQSIGGVGSYDQTL